MLFNFINFNSIPFHSPSNFDRDFDIIKEFIDDIDQNDEFSIVCLNGVYGYRSGIFGFLMNHLSKCIKNQPTCIKNFVNGKCFKDDPFYCNDIDIIASYCCYINRFIPILNFGYWDNQKTFINHNYFQSQLKYINNDSQQKLFSFSNPMLDSGCAFISNKSPLYKGFVPLEKSDSYLDKLINKGIQWNYYEIQKVGYIFITFNLSSDRSYTRKWFEIEEIICLANEIQLKYVNFDIITDFHCIIIGDFKIDLSYISHILSAFHINHLHDTTFLLTSDRDIPIQQNIVSNQTLVNIKIDKKKEEISMVKSEIICNPLHEESKEIEFENKEEIEFESKEQIEFESKEEIEFESKEEIVIEIPQEELNDISLQKKDNLSLQDEEIQIIMNITEKEKEFEEIDIVEIKDETFIHSYFQTEQDEDDEWTRI